MGSITSNPPAASSAGGTSFFNPSGVFGSGNVKFITASETFTVPADVFKVRARCFGGGGSGNASNSGGGGGFSLKVCDVTPAQQIAVTVGNSQGTSSFGAFCSATGGTSGGIGMGTGGDINTNGGYPSANSPERSGGGGVANYFGNGGNGGAQGGSPGFSGTSGGGGSSSGSNSTPPGGSGISGNGGSQQQSPGGQWNGTSGIDFIGTGGGGSGSSYNAGASQPGANGGGGGGSQGSGGFPGGGGAGNTGSGARGLVIVEW